MTCPHLVMFTVGTGVGGGLVLNGRLYRGATSAAPRSGHTVIGLDLEDGAPTPEGKHSRSPGRSSTLASGRALDRLAEREARQDARLVPGQAAGTKDGEVTGHDVVDGAKAGDADALRCLRVLGERLGIGIANAINTLRPAGDRDRRRRLDRGRPAARPRAAGRGGVHRPRPRPPHEIRLARHGAQAGVLGAALLALHEEEAK